MSTIRLKKAVQLAQLVQDKRDRAREALEALERAYKAVWKLKQITADSDTWGYVNELESRLRAERYLLTVQLEEGER